MNLMLGYIIKNLYLFVLYCKFTSVLIEVSQQYFSSAAKEREREQKNGVDRINRPPPHSNLPQV